jgi:hypothetical protein
MKTTLVTLIAGLFLLVTPMFAMAHGGDRHDGRSNQHKSWAKDRHDGDHYRDDRQHKWERKAKKHFKRHDRQHKWEKRARKHFKRHLREHRHERRHLARQYRQHDKRPHYAGSGHYYGWPNVVFRFDW